MTDTNPDSAPKPMRKHQKPEPESQSSNTTKLLVSLVALLTLVVVILLTFMVMQNNDDSPTNTSGSTSASVPPLSDDMKRALQVAEGDALACGDVDGNGLVSFTLESTKGVVPVGPRLWSDSLGLPVDGQDPVAGFKQTEYAIWHGPDVGVTYAHFLAKLQVGDTKLADLNPWLSDYNSDDSQINDQAASFLLPQNPTDDDYKKAFTRNKDYQSLACKVNTLLERFHVTGIDPNRPSVLNYRLKDGGLGINDRGLSEVESTTDVDNRPAIVLEVTSKTAGPCVPVFAIGINVGDKRPELFAPSQPSGCTTTKTTPGTSTTPGTTTSTTSCCGTTTTSTTPSTTTTTPSTTTSTTTTTTETTTSTTPSTTTTLPPKTNTPHPNNPGYTPMPTMGPSHTTPTPPPTNPAPPPASLPTDAPIIPSTTTRTNIPTQDPVLPPSVTETTVIVDPGSSS
jgi:hypothetical protein